MTTLLSPRAEPPSALERVLLLVLLLFYLLLAIYYVVLDYWLAVSLQPRFALLYGALAALPGLLIIVRRRPRAPIVALALFVALLLALPWISYGPRKPFLLSAARIAQGMSVETVDRLMIGYERYPPFAGALDDGVTAVYRNPYGSGDADAAVITFVEDQAVKVELLLD